MEFEEENNLEIDEASDEIQPDDTAENIDYSQLLNEDGINDEDYLCQIPEFSRVILYQGNSLPDEEWMRQRVKSDFIIEHYDKSVQIKEPFKYMSSKVLESNEALNEHLDDFIFDIKIAFRDIYAKSTDPSLIDSTVKDLADEESLSTKFKVKTAVETYYAGRIRYGLVNGKMNPHKVLLEAPLFTSRGDLVSLDLSSFRESDEPRGEISLFPGKIVILKGQNLNGNCISVSKFVEYHKLLGPEFPLKCPKILLGNESFNVICASGPFFKLKGSEIEITDTSQMKAIADYLKRYNPDVLFLFGPFFDESMYESLAKWSIKDDMTDNGGFPYQWNLDRLFLNQIKTLYKGIEGSSVQTQIVVIPSSNEFGKTNIYPIYPMDLKPYNSIQSFSNPALLNIGGIAIGVTSTDILLHMSRKETNNINPEKSKNGDRLKRLCEHILSHRHFYPLLPPDNSLNMEYPMYHHLSMTSTPHLLILPSVLRPFAYNIDGTIVVNPGKVLKNNMARIMFEPLKDQSSYSGSLSQYINVEVIKLIA